MNDRYDMLHSGNKSGESDSPKSSSHEDSAAATPDGMGMGSPSGSGQSQKLSHMTGGSTMSHRGTPEDNGGSSVSPSMSSNGGVPGSSAPGFPPHFSSLASYYSQLNQGHGGPLSSSLAAQYGHAPGVMPNGQNPYQMAHQSPGAPNSSGDFRRALPVIF